MIACDSAASLQVEVSDAGAVGTVTVPDDRAPISSGQVFQTLDADEVGLSEQSPIVVVAVKVASDVQGVEARFGDGTTDSMAPVGGWAVLVDAPGAAYDAGQALSVQLSAVGAGGVLGTVSLPSDTAEALPSACVPVPVESVPPVAERVPPLPSPPATTVPPTSLAPAASSPSASPPSASSPSASPPRASTPIATPAASTPAATPAVVTPATTGSPSPTTSPPATTAPPPS
jgi:hypothetical protein